MAVLAAVAVVLVVGVVVVAIAATRHQPRSTTGSSSITSPAASNAPATATDSPGAAANSPAVAAASPAAVGGVVINSTAGHFSARFPAIPIQQSVEETVAGVHASVRAAIVKAPLTEVIEEDLSSTVSNATQREALRSAIAVAAALATDGSATQQGDTTFRGKAARMSTFTTAAGEQLTALAFFQDSRTLYFLVAEAGAPFESLSTSLGFVSTSSPQVLS